jgi:hypothetical protein
MLSARRDYVAKALRVIRKRKDAKRGENEGAKAPERPDLEHLEHPRAPGDDHAVRRVASGMVCGPAGVEVPGHPRPFSTEEEDRDGPQPDIA